MPEPSSLVVYGCGVNAEPVDADPAVVERLVAGVGDVERPGRLAHHVGVGVLVDHVGGDGHRRGSRVLLERLDGEPVVVDGHEHAAAAGVGGALAAALGGLGRVPARPGRAAVEQRVGGDHRGVGGPAGDDHVGAGLQGGAERLGAEQADDVLAALERLGVERAGGRQRRDAAGVERAARVSASSSL